MGRTEGGLDGGGAVSGFTDRTQAAKPKVRFYKCVSERRKGCWGCGPMKRKIGNNVSATVKSKYLQGFNLRRAFSVGQSVCAADAKELGGVRALIRRTRR